MDILIFKLFSAPKLPLDATTEATAAAISHQINFALNVTNQRFDI